MKNKFNSNWICYESEKPEKAIPVSLPHDAMQMDTRDKESLGGINTGWYKAKDYVYEKRFRLPKDEKFVYILEFEGVYKDGEVFLNGQLITKHEYGYIGFFVPISNYLLPNEENLLQVKVKNSDQPNSRWYTGTGIYRDVWLHKLPKEHILLNGIKIDTIKTASKSDPKINVEIQTTGIGIVEIIIKDEDTIVTKYQTEINKKCVVQLDVPKGEGWSFDHPKLYMCEIKFGEDVVQTKFGLRTIEWDSQHGLRINGKREILKGACIHHDNGLLGAIAHPFAEKRKVQILKDAGYNAIRSAHNPCSKALLDACDELGMFVVDEYVDYWYIHKTKYDYAKSVEKNYKSDLKDMVDKDYNHPSVIMYCIGNEVAETSEKKGVEFAGKMTNVLHALDKSRPVTCGVNIFFDFLYSMGAGVYSDKKAETTGKKKKAVGSEFYNWLAGLLGADFMKFGATLPPCDWVTRDAFSQIDIAGYNYGISRYKHDMRKYPNRLILGSETFCSDAYKFYTIAQNNPQIIGDFVWSGMDYLGEVGIGAWEYEDYAPDFSHGPGWISAGAGRIDLTGKPLAEMKYTQVVFEKEKIGIGVIPVKYSEQRHSPSAWKMTNAIESWSWKGCDGLKTKVEVYARAHHVALYINKKHVGTKIMKNDCRVSFSVVYQSGNISAKAFTENDVLIAETSLYTAGDETRLILEPEQSKISHSDLLYVRMKYADNEGTVKPLERGEIKVRAKGGTIIGIGSACPYYEKSYQGDTCDTYYGEAMVILKPEDGNKIEVFAESHQGNAQVEVKVV